MTAPSVCSTNKNTLVASASSGNIRVAQIVQHLQPGGIESLALDLLRGSVADDSILVSLEDTPQNALANWPRLKAHQHQLFFMRKMPGIQISLIKKLVDCFRSQAIDVVHTHHIGPLIYAGIAARIVGIKHLVHTEHDAWHLTSFRRRLIQRLLIKLTQPTLIADAQIVADSMREHLGNPKVQVIRNGIDTQRFTPGDRSIARQQLGLPQKPLLIGCAGRLEYVKGQDQLIDALSLMSGSFHLALAGRGSQERALRAKVLQLGLCERVHFLGHVDNMPNFYRSLDTFVLPSREEGYPLSALEAQACSIKTAVTDVGGARETLCPLTGVAIEPGNITAMAKALSGLVALHAPADPRTFIMQHGDLNTMVLAYHALTE